MFNMSCSIFPASQNITKVKENSDIGRTYMLSKLEIGESKI